MLVCIFWANLLSLTNGMCFLFLFKRMAEQAPCTSLYQRSNQIGTTDIKELLNRESQPSSINYVDEPAEEQSVDNSTLQKQTTNTFSDQTFRGKGRQIRLESYLTSSNNTSHTSGRTSFTATGNENQFQIFMLNQVAMIAYKQAQT